MNKNKSFVFLGICLFAIAYVLSSCGKKSTIDFSTQVKPILNKNCISCHGGVKKQGGFSLLFQEESLAKGKSGKHGIVPGDAAASEMIRRLTLDDPEERMPYESDPLSKEDIEILTKWVDEGAQWGEHWAYVPVEEQEVPKAEGKTDIDKFVSVKAEEKGLSFSPEADPLTLARRVSLDIIGFPAPDSIRTIYEKDPNDKNYEKLVDQLLASPNFGEKWTTMWLDLARYADTKGYERDDSRSIWKYRDWLIQSFNEDMPYDQFLTEQLAGDLLPNPTENQYIATAFHRNSMTNDEGGTDNEEFRTAAVIDRVNTTWETLMGTTFACVQCHSHPYDPFRHEDYYKFMAFFNNTRDEDTFADYPLYRHYDEEQKTKLKQLSEWVAINASQNEAERLVKFLTTLQPSYNSLTCDKFSNAELADTKWLAMRKNGVARLKNVDLIGKNALIFPIRVFNNNGFLRIKKDSVNGEEIANINLKKYEQKGAWERYEVPVKAQNKLHDIYFVYDNPSLSDPRANGIMLDWFYFHEGLGQKVNNEQKKIFWELVNASPVTTPIMMDNPETFKRSTHVFDRGNWLAKGEEVAPGTPASLNNFPKDAAQNRLGLAKWMTDKKNPLVSRTMVNRVWEQIFGQGLVETLEDMGTQGAKPSHQELLDFLSYEFMHSDKWSMKTLIKKVVMSQTYRQSSKVSPELLEIDPSNEFLARGPRVRLSGEQIRDQALASCGAMSNEMYGKPVMPFQPEGIWNSPYDGKKWVKDSTENQYRRAVYIYWKRTSPYPSMITFDGAGREVCSSRRIRTNTPLQALATLNDSVYVDLSRIMARKTLLANKNEVKNAIADAYKRVIFKPITEEKLEILYDLYIKLEKDFRQKPKDAKALIVSNIEGIDAASYAAMTLVANSIFNLDEVITKT